MPEAEKESDVLRGVFRKRVMDGVAYYGIVQDSGQGKESGERLYHVKYTDGDVEHLVADQVRKWSRAFEEAASATQEQSAHQVRAAETGKRRARAHRQRALPRRQLIGRWLSQQ